uniref:Zinc finger protein 185 isoform X3 n=1 Tax=Geotrypetes seraphini TaxID=260995 RepID=A0A6P8RHX3_GEOSA|nr:zinc finger protein 185 isoform X3 [Geotrypetes seraphini]
MYAKKGGSKSAGATKSAGSSKSAVDADRKSILQQMKVRNTIKKDKSWIHEEPSSVNQKNESFNPNDSALESSKSYHISSPSYDLPKSNREQSWNVEENDRFSSASTNPLKSSWVSPAKSENDKAASSPPAPKNTGRTTSSTGYIIRGMYTKPIDSSTKDRQPMPANEYQNSVKAKSASLPRVPTASGYKMTTEDYKKLAPFNTRPRSIGDSDEEDAHFSSEEHSKRSEAASSIVKNTASKQRSYVLSAAKRSSGSPTQDIASPFLAKRVEVREEHSEDKKSQTLPPKMTPPFSSGSNRYYEITQTPNTSSTTETRTTYTSRESNNTYTKDSEWKSKVNSFSSAEKSMETSPRPLRPAIENETKPKVISSSDRSGITSRTPTSSSTVTRTATTKTESYDEIPQIFDKSTTGETRTRTSFTSKDSHDEIPQSLHKPTTGETRTRTSFTRKESHDEIPQFLDKSTTRESRSRTSFTSRDSYDEIPPIHDKSTTRETRTSFANKESDANSWTPNSSSSTVTRTATTVTKNESYDETPRILDKSTTRETRPRTSFTSTDSDANSWTPTSSSSTVTRTATTITKNESTEPDKWTPEPLSRSNIKPKVGNLSENREKPGVETEELISWTDSVPSKPMNSTEQSNEKKEPPKAAPRTEIRNRVSSKDSERTQPESKSMQPPLIIISPELNWSSSYEDKGEKGGASPEVSDSKSLWSGGSSATPARYTVPECLEDDNEAFTVRTRRTVSGSGDTTTTITTTRRETYSDNSSPSVYSKPDPSTEKPITHSTTTRSIYKVPEYLSDQESESDQIRSVSGSGDTTTTITTTRRETYSDNSSPSVYSKPDPSTEKPLTHSPTTRSIYKVPEYLSDQESESDQIRSVSGSGDTTTTITTTRRETYSDNSSPSVYSKPDPSTEKPLTHSPTTRSIYKVPEYLSDQESESDQIRSVSGSGDTTTTITTTRRETYSDNSSPSVYSKPDPSTEKPLTHSPTTRSIYKVPEYLSDQESESDQIRPNSNFRERFSTEPKYKDPMYLINLDSGPERSSSHSGRSTLTTTTSSTREPRTSEPRNTGSEYLNDKSVSTRFTSNSRERVTTTTTTSTKETLYENPSATHNRPDPNANSRGVLFLKEYVNTSELSSRNPSSPVYDTSSGGYVSDHLERESYSSNFSSPYNSAPRRSGEGPCTYCGREINDAKITLEHLNICCHEYCFKCAICHKPMGDLLDSIFIHRDVVHCQSCYEKLF